MEWNNSLRKPLKKMFLMIIILSLTGTVIYTFTDGNNNARGASVQQNTWSLTLRIAETSGTANTVVLGASSNASDGQDDLDLPEPPAPPQIPYLSAWFATSFSVPFNRLLQEYKHIPAQHMLWNLSILWVSESDNSSSTTVTISWDPTQVALNGFNSFQLYDHDTVVANMLTKNSYPYTTNGTLHHFQIIGQTAPTNGTSKTNDLGIGILIIVIIIAVLITYKRKK
jgi:hypothetical protein